MKTARFTSAGICRDSLAIPRPGRGSAVTAYFCFDQILDEHVERAREDLGGIAAGHGVAEEVLRQLELARAYPRSR